MRVNPIGRVSKAMVIALAVMTRTKTYERVGSTASGEQISNSVIAMCRATRGCLCVCLSIGPIESPLLVDKERERGSTGGMMGFHAPLGYEAAMAR